MDETDAPQTPPELLIILAAVADEKLPIQTIAPKFTGRFNKGVDYVAMCRSSTRSSARIWPRSLTPSTKYGPAREPESSAFTRVRTSSPSTSRSGEALKDTGAGVHVKTAVPLAGRAHRSGRKRTAMLFRSRQGSLCRGLRALRRTLRTVRHRHRYQGPQTCPHPKR